ncbi:alginate O-acetyltransferase AlgX-related protein [Diplocloster modestus]|uniref:AlgX/AlgJ SGNH hydrolase-like domain-containing protein n=1 Tax=Diplocloster modestus TaxID=2850322 RepID=A0ABS6K2P9_9FIRM|nr:hypothetical protein [Diplocloster modestus]MBU9724635.1 hypothetical protein [Diplocloster modestus]
MKKGKVNIYLLLFGIFTIMLALPTILGPIVHSGFDSELEKRKISSKPDYSLSNISNWSKETEAYYNDRFAFRDKMITLNTEVKAGILKTSSSDLVVYGKDGWLFYTGDNNFQIARGLYPMDSDMMIKVKNNQTVLKEYFAKKGMKYYLILVPSKVSVYPEYLPDNGKEMTDRTPVDILEDYLNEYTDINVINVKKALIEAKDTGKLYHKTDTHWTERGAYVAYQNIINETIKNNDVTIAPAEVTYEKGTFKGDFSGLLGNDSLLEPEIKDISQILDCKSIEIADGSEYEKWDAIRSEDGVSYPIKLFQNGNVPEDKLLYYGDSFSHNFNVPELFSQNYSEMMFVRSDAIKDDMIEAFRPDVVYLQRTERFIDQLANDLDPLIISSFVEGASGALNVENRNDKVIVSAKNIGDSSWERKYYYKLAFFRDGVDTGKRLEIPDTKFVNPGEEIQFDVTDIVDQEGNTGMTVQMIVETIGGISEPVELN